MQSRPAFCSIPTLISLQSRSRTKPKTSTTEYHTDDKMPLTGHCLCKAVTYKVDVDEPILTGYDHCDDCQRQSGSTYCEFLLYLTCPPWKTPSYVASARHATRHRSRTPRPLPPSIPPSLSTYLPHPRVPRIGMPPSPSHARPGDVNSIGT